MYARRYVQAQNETASPERLMVLLFETALRHIRTSIVALEAGRFEEAAIASESRHPELGENLSAVYKFTGQHLLMGVARRDPKMFRHAERAFAPIADAFTTAVAKVASETAAGATR
jgi:flagellar protein FliS